ncbi:MAG: glycosyltransferase family 2 protein [Proteobacteria bacterium]|nr:glycosyltransferase family 2 protein [Pseudomonadota bacterium]
MTSPSLQVSIIVITMDRPDFVARCLGQIAAQSLKPQQVIVVDNSTQPGGEALKAEFPFIDVVQLPPRQGANFPRNRGLEAARGDVCVFIDDDVTFDDATTLARLVAYFENPGVGLLAVHVMQGDTGQTQWNALPRDWLARRSMPAGDVPCALFCGACFAVRREWMVKAGMFWERLFLHHEEMELSHRLVDAGCEFVYSPSVRVRHYYTHSPRSPSRSAYYSPRNILWIALRNLPVRYGVPLVLRFWMLDGAKALAGGEIHHFLRGLWHGLSGVGAVLRERRPISLASARKIRALKGFV